MIKNKYPTTKPSLNLDFANTKSLDPRITFRRGTPGTYYDGVTHVKAEENLIDYSEDFSQWSKYELSVTSNDTTAPDGSTTADKISDSTVDGPHALYKLKNYTRGTYIFSSFFKSSGDDRYIAFRSYIGPGIYFYVVFDPVTGSVTHSENAGQSIITLISASSVSYSGGWHRGIVVFNVSGTYNTTSLGWQITNSPVVDASSNPHNSSFVGDGSSGFYLWGAQLEQRDSVTSYTATNGAPITKYQPKLMTAAADNARFDHDPLTGESKGLLIEEQRTNLITYSEDFDSNIDINFYFSTYNGYRAIAPDGTLTASEIIWDDSSTAGLAFGDRPAVSPGQSYTLSMYIKAGNLSKIYFYQNIRQSDEAINSGGAGIKYDLINQVVDEAVDPDGKFNLTYDVLYVGNGWHRLSVTTIMPSDAGYLGWGMYNYASNVQAGNNTAYFWGAQLEEGSFATSYIKTTGASATRSADNASITGENFSSWYRQDEGSFEIDASLLSSSTTQTGRFITISDGSTGNKIQIDNNNTTLNFYIGTRSAQQGLYTWDRDTVLDYKFAFGLKKDDVAFCKNNESVAVDSSVELFAANRLDIKHENNFLEQLNGHIKKLAYYPQRLTNEQLQNLTK